MTSRILLALLLGGVCCAAHAGPAPAEPRTVPVVMLSDIHFDPFHDPAKVAELRRAPASAWQAILLRADSPTQGVDFAALEKNCGAHGIDTPMPLLVASLAAQKAVMPDPLFVTVSGDLMGHNFDCKFKALAHNASEAEYSAFAAKTVEFLALQLHATFPHAPIYVALGNNDSGCRDYREDENSAYLQADAKAFADVALNAKNAAAIESEFPRLGDYNVALPRPMEHTRLIVIQDIFAAKSFESCAEKPETRSAELQIQWLREQLTAARARHETVWILGHIPPGVNPFAKEMATLQVCNDGAPAEGFLRTQDLEATLADFADVIRLAIFGHTHMDEIHLLRGSGQAAGYAIPLKVTPAVTAYSGNYSAFLIAQVDPATATLVDYTVYGSNNQTGIGPTWSKEYDFRATYHLPDFSAASVKKLMADFVSDPNLKTQASHTYIDFFSTGNFANGGLDLRQVALAALWHAYGCSASDGSQAAFKACFCAQMK